MVYYIYISSSTSVANKYSGNSYVLLTPWSEVPRIHLICETAHLSSPCGSMFISAHKLSQYDVTPALIRQSGKVVASVNCSNWLRKIPSHWPLPKISFIALKWINPIYIQHQCHLDYGWFRALHWEEKGVIRKNIAVD